MRKVSSFSIGALAVLLLTVLLLGCGGGRSAPTGSNLKSMPAGTIDLNEALAELDALQAPAGVDPAIFAELKDSLRGGLINRGKIVLTPSVYSVNDFAEILPSTNPPAFSWSSNFFIADGDISGAVGITDITPIAMFYGQKPSENPLAMVADYNRDDIVNVADITPLAQTFGQTTAGFTIEYSDADTGPWTVAGTLDWDDMLPDKNANGFAVFNYTFPTGMLANGDWFIRITPYDAETSAPGVPNTPIQVTVGGVQPQDFIVTGIRLKATGTLNTDPGDPTYNGTDLYVAPAGGGDTYGEGVANGTVLMDLDKVSYTWKLTAYNFDDPLPADLDQATYDGFIADLKDFMSYSVTSLTTPADPEAWTASATQPPTGYEGKLGPNDDLDPPNQDAVLFTAHMADNDYTQGAATFDITVQVDLLVDVNAPLIWDFQPPTQPQNKTILHTVRFDFGDNEVGDELPIEVALYDKATMLPAFTFTPATIVETTDPPTNPGEYTLQRFPGNPTFTTQVTILVAGSQLTQGIAYVYRVSEDDGAGGNLRSSLKKPGSDFSVIGPELFDMNTWPEEEFYGVDPRQPYLYFVPQDPLIRRNPLGHRDMSTPPQFVYDDPTAASDMVKNYGDEFMIIFGQIPEPDSPSMYYREGLTPPATIAEADGELPIAYRQPHLLAGLCGIFEFTTPGDISFSMFSKEGTLLGSVSRLLGTMQIVRGTPVISDGDFGVRPWGLTGDLLTPDFSDKTASIGSNDVVVFTFYNMWLRHDDGEGLSQDQRGTHLLLLDKDSMAQLPDLLFLNSILGSAYNGDKCYMYIDVSNPDWWQNITQPIPVGSYIVRLETPGAGFIDYPYDLGVDPPTGLLTVTP